MQFNTATALASHSVKREVIWELQQSNKSCKPETSKYTWKQLMKEWRVYWNDTNGKQMRPEFPKSTNWANNKRISISLNSRGQHIRPWYSPVGSDPGPVCSQARKAERCSLSQQESVLELEPYPASERPYCECLPATKYTQTHERWANTKTQITLQLWSELTLASKQSNCRCIALHRRGRESWGVLKIKF